MKTRKTVLLIIGAYVLLHVLLIGGFFGYSMIEQKINDHRAENVVRPKAETYLRERYPNMDLEITACCWSWYNNQYQVDVQSPTSRDTHFSLTYSTKEMELEQDSFESEVPFGWNTYHRLEDAYTDLVKQAASRAEELNMRGSFCWENRLDPQSLILDADYDIRELGSGYGQITLYIYESEDRLNMACAMEYLTKADRLLTENGVPYRAMDITLVYDGKQLTTWDMDQVTPEDLACENPLPALEAKWAQQEAHRQEVRASLQ